MEILVGDSCETLKTLADQSVHCCVTSPPYFGLRDYGVDGQIGLEDTPDAYVARLVEVFREVHRVLRGDGTVWLNLGDSYAGGGGHSPNAPSSKTRKSGKYGDALKEGGIKPQGVVKAKDLIGIPWRVAFALQADGWYLRQDIIWHKPNPMPENIRDRCTKSHEYVFLLSKGPKYYYDAEAIKQPAKYPGDNRAARKDTRKVVDPYCVDHGSRKRTGKPTADKVNRRSVWTVTTKPYKEAHFATFPPDLIEPCVLAGCPVGGVVLDPFGGSGTTAGVATKHYRRSIMCELNPEYAALIPARVEKIAGADAAEAMGLV